MTEPMPAETPLPPPPMIATPVILDRPAQHVQTSLVGRSIRAVGRHFWGLDRWKKLVLILALILGVVGAVGSVGGFVRTKPAEVAPTRQRIESLHATARTSNLTPTQAAELTQAQTQLDGLRHWFYDKTAPQLWRIGLGFAIAFLLGYLARQFLKTVAILAAIVLVATGIAIYLGGLDFARVRSDVTNGTGWIMDRLPGFKDQLLALVSASVSGTAGFVIGFMRNTK